MGGGEGGGWRGWGVVGVAGWRRWGSRRQVKVTIKRQTAVVCPVSGTDSLNPQDRPRQSLATVWHYTHPY